MLVNILQTFDTPGRRWFAGDNPDVDASVARAWIADGKAAADLTPPQADQLAINALVSGGGIAGVVSNNVASAATNTTKINEALAAGKTVELTEAGAVFWINDTLVQYSNSRLITRNGAQIRMASGVNKSVVVNQAANAAWNSVTMAWTAGNTATATWVGNTLSVGDYLWLDDSTGTSQSQYRGIFLVFAKSGDDLTIKLWKRPTAAPSGTFQAKKADTNIFVSGAFDYNVAGNPSAIGTDTIALTFAGVKKGRAPGLDVYNTKKYCISLEGVDDFEVTDLFSPNASSDGYKDYGPSRNARLIGISGFFGDDISSIQPKEAAAYSQYTRTSGGDTISCSITNIRGISTNASGAVFYGSASEYADDILIEDVDCYTASQMVKIYNGNLYSNGQNGLLRIKDIRWDNSSDLSVLVVDASSTWQKIEVDGLLGNTAAGVAGITKSPINFNTGSAGAISIKNVRGYLGSNIPLISFSSTYSYSELDVDASTTQATASNGTLVKLGGTGTVRAMRIRNAKVATFAKLVEVASSMTSSPIITLQDCDVNSAVVVEAAGACDIVLAGGNRFTAATAVVNASGTGTAISITTHGKNKLASGNWLASSGTPVIAVTSDEFSCDITKLARVDGARVYNSNASANNGTDGAVGAGLFVCLGTASGSWKRVGTTGGASNQY